jgi:hypothetical protein
VGLFGVERQDLPRNLTIGYHQGRNRFGAEPPHRGQPVPAVRSPEPGIGSGDGDDGVKKATGLINDICEPLVMGIREIPLKRGGLDSADGQNRKQQRMPPKGVFPGSHHTTAGFFDGFDTRGSASGEPVEEAFCRAQTPGARFCFSRTASDGRALDHDEKPF